jgi:CheY-like chemotaxis protein
MPAAAEYRLQPLSHIMADVLLVDDDRDLVDAFGEVLRALGHKVRVASNGFEGLAELSEQKPDVIITDVDMPVLDGPGMALQILAHDAGDELIPIILTSGSKELARVAASLGTPYQLAKPFALAKLIETLRQALTERRAPQPVPPKEARAHNHGT